MSELQWSDGCRRRRGPQEIVEKDSREGRLGGFIKKVGHAMIISLAFSFKKALYFFLKEATMYSRQLSYVILLLSLSLSTGTGLWGQSSFNS